MAITTLPGTNGADTSLVGTSGSDSFAVKDYTKDIFIGAQQGADTATITGTVSSYTTRMGSGADTLTFSNGLESSFVNGNGDNDTITVTGALIGSTVEGGKGNDTLANSSTIATSLLQGRFGVDTITVTGTTTNSTVNGNEDDDTITLTGLVKGSKIYGGKAEDTITAAEVNSTAISGNVGDDKITVTGALDTVTINGNDGTDTIAVSSATATKASVYGGAGRDIINLTGAGALYVSGDAANDTISIGTGADGNNTVTGGLGADSVTLTGTGKNNITGDGGNDTVSGAGTGDNTIAGGDGDDSVNLTVAGKVSITGGTGTDTITLAGTANVTVNGNAGTDIITVGSGKDKINGGTDNDTIALAVDSLTSDDVISGDAGEADIIDFNAEGAAIVDADFGQVTGVEKITTTFAATALVGESFTLGAKSDVAGITIIDMSGMTGTTTVTVDAGENDNNLVFTGSDTTTLDYTVTTGDGADTFTTGNNADSVNKLTGGVGTNTYNINSAGANTISDLKGSDVLVLDDNGKVTATVTADFVATAATINRSALGSGLLVAADGIDINMSAATSTVTGFTINAGTNAAASTLIGSDQADSITGGSGADSVVGGALNDTLAGVLGIDSIDLGTGTSQVNFSETAAADRDTVANFTVGTDVLGLSTTDTTEATLAGAVADFESEAVAAANVDGASYDLTGLLAANSADLDLILLKSTVLTNLANSTIATATDGTGLLEATVALGAGKAASDMTLSAGSKGFIATTASGVGYLYHYASDDADLIKTEIALVGTFTATDLDTLVAAQTIMLA